MKELNPKISNTTALAYMGDAVYEIYIRKYVLTTGRASVDKLTGKTISFVRADSQAGAIREMVKRGFLFDEEAALVRRARNHTNTSRPRGSTAVAYKWATGFEALLGYLYLKDDRRRLDEVIKKAIEITEEREQHHE